MKKIFWLVLLLVFNSLTGSCRALDSSAEEIRIYMGEMRAIPVHSPTRIVIGNPAVADVSNANKSEITIVPKSAGSTTLVFWDNFGEQSFKIKVFSENMEDIKLRVDNLLSRLNLTDVYTKAEEEEGKVLILGSVKTPQERERLSTILGALRDKTVDLVQIKEEETVIDIDVQVMELNKDATTALGLSWPGQVKINEDVSPMSVPFSKMGALFRVLNLTRDSGYSLTLDALVQEGKAQILSRPHVACLSGKEAELTVGGEKPIFTTQVVSGGGSGTSVEYKEYGIKLKIKPVLTDDNRIKLGVNVEVSDVGIAETIGQTGSTNITTAKAYPLSKRSASTELYLDNGQTMVIGGLIKKKSEEDVRKVPGLGNIPIFGAAFRSKTAKSGGGQGERGDTELFITLTPTLMIQESKAQAEQAEKKEAQALNAIMMEERPVDPHTAYAKIVQERIMANFTYPREARENGYQGTVKLRLLISYTGEILEAVIKESSGFQLLDEQAVIMARRAGSFPPFPTAIEEKELWIDMPLTFQLK